MGWRAGTTDKADDEAKSEETAGEETEAAETASPWTEAAEASGGGAKNAGSKRGIYLLLGGLVVAGVAAGWNWLRGLPKD